jgi:DNA polymerase-3 subunit chi
MTRVDFYVTGEADELSRLRLACRIADKAYRDGRKIYIHTESLDDAKRVDDLLWTFRAGSFVQHAILGDADTDEEPVVIGPGDAPRDRSDVLINLAREVPEYFSRFERVAEVIDGEAQNKQDGRERYRFYRDRGYPLETHEV